MANRNWASGGKIYSMHVSPVLLDCNFVVDNTEPTGISDLKGPAIEAVYMKSSAATPAKVVAEGVIVVQLEDNYNRMFSVKSASIQAPTSGSDIKIDNSALTPGVPYVITTLGDATAEKWHAIGVPVGVTPAEGVSFIATTNGGTGNTLTSRVQAANSTGSGIASIEVLGNPDLSVAPSPSANQGFGSQVILLCRDYTGALAAPAAGSKIFLELYMSNSSIKVMGE